MQAVEPGPSAQVVTVVVPARNEELHIGECLTSVLAQDWPDLQVLVVDGMSDDRTRVIVDEFARRDSRVELLVNPERIIPVSLNMALNRARGAWLVRVDAHAVIPQDYVRLARQHLMTGRYGAVGGRKAGVGRTPAGVAIAAVMTSRFGVGGSTYHWGSSVRLVEHVPFGAYPVELLRSLGGWDPALVVNQDFELDYRIRRAGYDILFDPGLRIDWECRQTLRSFYRQYKRYGHGKVVVARKHPGSLRPRHLAAPALIVNLIAALLASLHSRKMATAMVVPYAAGLVVATSMNVRRLDRSAGVLVLPAFLTMHVGWGVGFWQRVVELILDGLRKR